MGQPYKNNEIRTAIKSLLKLEQYTDKVPSEISDKISLIVDVSPLKNKVCNIIKYNTASNATSAIIYTTPDDVDFYISSIVLSFIKDVTSTSTGSWINVPLSNSTVTFIHLPQLTLTAQNQSVTVNLTTPIKVDRSSNITVNNATNVGNISASGTIIGFTVDNRIYDMGIGAANQ